MGTSWKMIYRDLGQECQWQAVRLLCIVQGQNANRKNPATTRDSGKSARGNESLTKYFKKMQHFHRKASDILQNPAIGIFEKEGHPETCATSF